MLANLIRRVPGEPELLGTGRRMNGVDLLAVYRARFAGLSIADNLRPFLGAPGAKYRFKGVAIPNAARQTFGARATVEDNIAISPGSFLTAITGFSVQATGFRWNLTEKATGAHLGADWPAHGASSGGNIGPATPLKGSGNLGVLPFVLPAMWAVASDAEGHGILSIQITNLSTAINYISMLFCFAERVG